MALQSDAPQVHDALETLGSFYRNFLSKGSRDIPLRNEIMIVKDYLALQSCGTVRSSTTNTCWTSGCWAR